MISVETEKTIRSFLALGGTSKARIAREVGVSVDTVRKISRLPALREREAVRTSIGLHEITKITKHLRCSGCGALINTWPCLTCHPNGGMPGYPCPVPEPRVIKATKILKENVPELIHISQDILNLDKLRIECLNHPLFRVLTSRASKVLRKINIKEGEFIDVKFE